MSDEKIKELFEPGCYEVVPHDSMRKIIAQRLVAGEADHPAFLPVARLRPRQAACGARGDQCAAPKDADGKPVYKISVNDFVIKALALALMRVPDANVTWTEGGMLKHKHADVGVAVAIPGGLITPVVRKAETKSLSVISNEMKDFAARARARKLKPEEYQGGTTAVSNLGMFGDQGILRRDQPAARDHPRGRRRRAARRRARRQARGRDHDDVTLSTDHRAVDGALGAELLAAFKHLIESPIGDAGVREPAPHEVSPFR